MSFSRIIFALFAGSALFLSACASGTYRARQEQREKVTAMTGLYCEFVNGDQHPDIDVELNLQMARRCNMNKQFSITNYRTSSEMNGIMYCCQVANARHERRHSARVAPATKPAPAAKTAPADKSDELSDEDAISNQ